MKCNNPVRDTEWRSEANCLRQPLHELANSVWNYCLLSYPAGYVSRPTDVTEKLPKVRGDKSVFLRFEVFTAVTMKKAVFWDVPPCRCGVRRRLGGTYRLHLQGRRKNKKIRKRRDSENRCKQIFLFSFYPEDGGDTFLRNVS
jgi:hypothetical protein